MHRIAHAIGHHIGDDVPAWMHPILDVVLVLVPTAFLVVSLAKSGRLLVATVRSRRTRIIAASLRPPAVVGFENSLFRYILRNTGLQQVTLIALGLVSMPILYAALELPKVIINNAIDSGHFPIEFAGRPLEQTEYLFTLCGLYVAAILSNGALKYVLNVRKGRVGERLLRRLRLGIWRRSAGSHRRSEVIPIIAQEVEPIGGFAADAFALPVFQGGTFITILFFMFMQDPILGAAAVTLLPVQLALIPRLQQRVNRLARARVAEVRSLGGELGDQASGAADDGAQAPSGAASSASRSFGRTSIAPSTS